MKRKRLLRHYEKDAFEAGQSGKFNSFESWYDYHYLCQDCKNDTIEETIHICPNKPHSYRNTRK